MRRDMTRPRRARCRARGQSLVEFALILPAMLLLVLFGIDFGRIFLGWVELNNVVRDAANFAAENPSAWNTVSPNTAVQSAYRTLVANDTAGINCALPSTIPGPTFAGGASGAPPVGSPVYVRISCDFAFITPVIGAVLGGSLPVAASASYPTRGGMIPNIPAASVTPMPSSSSDVASESPSPTVSPSSSASSSPTPAPSPTPTPMCTAPNFKSVKAQDAEAHWAAASFTTQVLFNPLAPATWPSGGGNIIDQSLVAGLSYACDSTGVTVTWK